MSSIPAGTNTNLQTKGLWTIIAAAAAGTVIEWYDFYLFGSLATIIAALYFPKSTPIVALLATLATFATGFAVRPLGAVFFGRIGDLIGRKYAFLVTMLIMGGATTAMGLVPTYASIGMWGPAILVLLRLLQGLALGGEYGGAAIYVAEHVPDHKRGFYTSFIQTTATVGLLVSLLVVLVTRLSLGEAAFQAWGWRIPFLISFLLVAISFFIRMRLKESPLFSQLKQEGKSSKAPLTDSIGRGSGRNWKMIFLVLFGATAGQGVVWYTGQFYSLTFLQKTLNVPFVTANTIMAIALVLGTPFFLYFGSLSDRIGRKKIMMAGNLLAVLLYLPIYMAMKMFATNVFMLTVLVFAQVLLVTMVYGPIAAFLVEVFPAKIRYTSLSIPYHLGNGWFGGFTPFIAVSLVALTGNIYAGLAYPILIAAITFVVGSLYLKETNKISIWSEVDGTNASVAGD